MVESSALAAAGVALLISKYCTDGREAELRGARTTSEAKTDHPFNACRCSVELFCKGRRCSAISRHKKAIQH